MLSNVKSALLAMQRYSWEQGVAAQAFLESGDDDIVIQMCYDAINRQTPDGRLCNIGNQRAVTDPIAIVPALVRACELTNDPVLISGLALAKKWLVQDAPRSHQGIIYHVDNACQIWVDSMYMCPPSLLSLGDITRAVQQADGYISMLYDTEHHLFRHIWDDGKGTFVNPAFWGVGNGWALSGLARLIERLPKAYATRYIKLVSETIDAALTLMDGHLFHNVLDDKTSFIETNFAQMLCYTIYKGTAQGWLDGNLCDTAEAIRTAVMCHVSPHGLVQNACGAPTFDKPGIAPEAQAFFILMEAARNEETA